MEQQVIASGSGGQLIIGCLTELVTIAAAATSTSARSLLPPNSVLIGVTATVTVIIPTAATFTIGDDAGNATRFGSGVLVAAGTKNVNVGINNPANADAVGPVQVAAAKILITPNLTPGAATGRVRVEVWFMTFVAPTS